MSDLHDLIELHRSMYREELRVPLTVRYVPADTEPIPVGNLMVDVTDSGPLGGQSLSPSMTRRLGPAEGYGARYPWAHSWSFLKRACRSDHPGHMERSVFGGSLCWQAVSWCVISEYTPTTIGRIMDIPTESVERHLRNAFAWIEEDIDRKQRIRNARDPRPSEDSTPSRLTRLQCDAAHRAVDDFDLEQRIWTSHRNLHPDLGLVEWDLEWARRLQVLWAHQQQCDRCRRAA